MDYLHTEKPSTLDITSFKEKGEELKTAINNAVKDTQRVIIRALPDKILMTSTQYEDLSPSFIASGYGDRPFQLYRTPLNIMEIEVKND